MSQLNAHVTGLVLLVLALIAGCSHNPPTTHPGQLPPVVDSQPVDQGSHNNEHPSAPNADSATIALLDQSRLAQDAGAYGQAINYLERAIRIEPKRADLWLQLAGLHRDNASPMLAKKTATKAITLAGDRVDWKRAAWLVVADSEQALGNAEKAQNIRRQWESFPG